MEFVDVKNDIAFRKIFGNENRKEVLISFLNAVLAFEEGHRITAVTIMNPYQLPKLNKGKVTIVDVKATDQSGRTFIVEMQVADAEGFDQRVQYYVFKGYTDQIKRGDFYLELKPVVFIGILNFKFTKSKHYLSRHQIRNVETGEHVLNNVEFNFIELPKFKLKEKALTSLVEKWVYFIKNADNLDVVPDNTDDAGLHSAYEEANMQRWSKKELQAYDYTAMREQDARGRVSKALKVALREALDEAAIKADQEKRAALLEAENQKQAALLEAENEKQAALLNADNQKQAALLEAEKVKNDAVNEVLRQSILAFWENNIPVAVIATSLKVSEQFVAELIQTNQNQAT